jgi:hypothetical protein
MLANIGAQPEFQAAQQADDMFVFKIAKKVIGGVLRDSNNLVDEQANDAFIFRIAKKILSNNLNDSAQDDLFLFKIAKKVAVPVAKAGFKVG